MVKRETLTHFVHILIRLVSGNFVCPDSSHHSQRHTLESTMSDPTLPVPELDPAPRRRKIGRKWIVSIAVVLVLALALGGAAYWVHTEGDAKAEDYAKALDAWDDQRNAMLEAPAEANSELWDFNDATTKKSVAKQKVACERVLTLRASTAKNAAAVPEAPDSFFKLLSSAEREAIKDSVTRKKAVKAYARAADKVLLQLRKDCTWNIKVNATRDDAPGSKKIFAKAKAMLLKPGQSVGNYYCPSTSKGPCLPVSVQERTTYVELILKGIRVEKDYFTKRFFAAGSCDRTSYGELCATLKSNLSSYYANLGKFSAVIKSIAPSNSKLRKEYDQMVKDNKEVDKSFKKALLKAHPKFKSDYRVSKYPFWQEAYFSAMAVDSIAELDKLRKAVLFGSATGVGSLEALGELPDVRLR